MVTRIYKRYFATASSMSLSDLRGDLWADEGRQERTESVSSDYSTLVLEQYKIYVEMADRVSARRGLTNTFFLTLNSAIFAAIGFGWENGVKHSSWFLVFPTIIFVAQCFTWHFLVRSYRQLNGAKYAVVGAMEERLPASPYWRAEWKALGSGEDPARYWPITHLEQWIPLLFAVTYIGSFIAAMSL